MMMYGPTDCLVLLRRRLGEAMTPDSMQLLKDESESGDREKDGNCSVMMGE